jgi:hypothetical protein
MVRKGAERRRYLKPCLEQHRHFTPFVVSAIYSNRQGSKTLLGGTFLSWLKGGEPYSVVWLCVMLKWALLHCRSYTPRRLSYPQPNQMSDRRPRWEGKAGLGLFKMNTPRLQASGSFRPKAFSIQLEEQGFYILDILTVCNKP